MSFDPYQLHLSSGAYQISGENPTEEYNSLINAWEDSRDVSGGKMSLRSSRPVDALKAGGAQMGATYNHFEALLRNTFNDEEGATKALRKARDYEELGQLYRQTHRVPTLDNLLDDERDVSAYDWFNYLTFEGLAVAPHVAGTVAAAATGGLTVHALGSVALRNLASREAKNAMRDRWVKRSATGAAFAHEYVAGTGDTYAFTGNEAASAVAGIGVAGLNFFSNLSFARALLGKAANEGERVAAKTYLQNTLDEGRRSLVREGVTEELQTELQLLAKVYSDPTFEWGGDEANMMRLESVILGITVGGTAGAASGTLGKLTANVREGGRRGWEAGQGRDLNAPPDDGPQGDMFGGGGQQPNDPDGTSPIPGVDPNQLDMFPPDEHFNSDDVPISPVTDGVIPPNQDQNPQANQDQNPQANQDQNPQANQDQNPQANQDQNTGNKDQVDVTRTYKNFEGYGLDYFPGKKKVLIEWDNGTYKNGYMEEDGSVISVDPTTGRIDRNVEGTVHDYDEDWGINFFPSIYHPNYEKVIYTDPETGEKTKGYYITENRGKENEAFYFLPIQYIDGKPTLGDYIPMTDELDENLSRYKNDNPYEKWLEGLDGVNQDSPSQDFQPNVNTPPPNESLNTNPTSQDLLDAQNKLNAEYEGVLSSPMGNYDHVYKENEAWGPDFWDEWKYFPKDLRLKMKSKGKPKRRATFKTKDNVRLKGYIWEDGTSAFLVSRDNLAEGFDPELLAPAGLDIDKDPQLTGQYFGFLVHDTPTSANLEIEGLIESVGSDVSDPEIVSNFIQDNRADVIVGDQPDTAVNLDDLDKTLTVRDFLWDGAIQWRDLGEEPRARGDLSELVINLRSQISDKNPNGLFFTWKILNTETLYQTLIRPLMSAGFDIKDLSIFDKQAYQRPFPDLDIEKQQKYIESFTQNVYFGKEEKPNEKPYQGRQESDGSWTVLGPEDSSGVPQYILAKIPYKTFNRNFRVSQDIFLFQDDSSVAEMKYHGEVIGKPIFDPSKTTSAENFKIKNHFLPLRGVDYNSNNYRELVRVDDNIFKIETNKRFSFGNKGALFLQAKINPDGTYDIVWDERQKLILKDVPSDVFKLVSTGSERLNYNNAFEMIKSHKKLSGIVDSKAQFSPIVNEATGSFRILDPQMERRFGRFIDGVFKGINWFGGKERQLPVLVIDKKGLKDLITSDGFENLNQGEQRNLIYLWQSDDTLGQYSGVTLSDDSGDIGIITVDEEAIENQVMKLDIDTAVLPDHYNSKAVNPAIAITIGHEIGHHIFKQMWFNIPREQKIELYDIFKNHPSFDYYINKLATDYKDGSYIPYLFVSESDYKTKLAGVTSGAIDVNDTGLVGKRLVSDTEYAQLEEQSMKKLVMEEWFADQLSGELLRMFSGDTDTIIGDPLRLQSDVNTSKDWQWFTDMLPSSLQNSVKQLLQQLRKIYDEFKNFTKQLMVIEDQNAVRWTKIIEDTTFRRFVEKTLRPIVDRPFNRQNAKTPLDNKGFFTQTDLTTFEESRVLGKQILGGDGDLTAALFVEPTTTGINFLNNIDLNSDQMLSPVSKIQGNRPSDKMLTATGTLNHIRDLGEPANRQRLANSYRNLWRTGVSSLLGRMFFSIDTQLRNMGQTGANIADFMYNPDQTNRRRAGWKNRSFDKQRYFNGKVEQIFGSMSSEDRVQVLDAFAVWTEGGSNLQQVPDVLKTGNRHIKLQQLFKETSEYVGSIEGMGTRLIEDYFPHYFDASKLEDTETRQLFANMVYQKHKAFYDSQAEGTQSTGQGIVNVVIERMIDKLLAEGTQPNFTAVDAQSLHTRKFPNLKYGELRELGVVFDPLTTLSRYMHDIPDSIEWNRLFGERVDGVWKPGYKLEQLITELPTRKEQDRARDMILAYQGKYKAKEASENPGWLEAQSYAMVLQHLTTGLFYGISSLTDPFVATIRSKEFSALGRNYGLIFEAIRSPQRRAEMEQLAKELGIVTVDTVQNALQNSYGAEWMTPGSRTISEWWFKSTGLETITKFSRVIGAQMGIQFLLKHADPATMNENSVRYLADLNLTAQDVADWVNGEDQGTHFNTEKGQIVASAIRKFAEESTLRSIPGEKPLWHSDPRFMLFSQLKSFFYSMASKVIRPLWEEYKIRRGEGRSVFAASMPAILAGFALMPLSAMALGIREEIRYEDEEDEPTNRMNPAEYMWELFSRAGFLAHYEIIYSMFRSEDFGQPFWVSPLGPTAGMLAETIDSDGVKSLDRFIPVLSQINRF